MVHALLACMVKLAPWRFLRLVDSVYERRNSVAQAIRDYEPVAALFYDDLPARFGPFSAQRPLTVNLAATRPVG